jgi:hypothetical protein
MFEVLLNILTVFLIVFIGLKVFSTVHDMWNVHKLYKDIEKQQEVAENYVADLHQPPKQAYDVEAFHKRMDEMRADTSFGVLLYDVPPPAIDYGDETGVEIITPSQEKRLDERFGR